MLAITPEIFFKTANFMIKYSLFYSDITDHRRKELW